MTDPVINVSHLDKYFKIYTDKGVSLKERILFKERNKYTRHHVLQDISFQVGRGDVVGIIGRNGSGKSTLLKLLSRIMYPNSGSINVTGKISCLIELGAGFHADLSGRDNIYTNASIYGLSREEITKRLDNIIEFSELEGFIDNPIRTYSSGMYARLAFAVAINVSADVLLIDEILSVGDASFQVKCFDKMRDIRNSGVTIVLVSHSHQKVAEFCDRVIWLSDGGIAGDGPATDIINQYLVASNQRPM